ncbi:MAG: DMT family transporter [Pseudomonadota bacterium]|nr:DMT family transporter [Pseudomonadota bacterium]
MNEQGHSGRDNSATALRAVLLPLLPLLALVAGAVGMGASPIFVRLADVGPFTSAFWRMALALPVLGLWLYLERRPRRISGRAPIRLRDNALLIGLIGFFFAGDLFFWHLAILNTTVANATLLAVMSNLIVALGAWVVLKERVTPRIAAGVLVGCMGASLLIGSSARFDPANVTGDVFGLITACFFGSYFLAVSLARRSFTSAEVMFYPAVITTILLFIVAVGFEDQLLPQSLAGLAALGALAMVSQIGGQGLTAYALGHLPAVFSSLVLFIEALAAATLAWLLFGEPVSQWQLWGGILILAGIYLGRPVADEAAEGK